jgi:hypothetical protein
MKIRRADSWTLTATLTFVKEQSALAAVAARLPLDE